MGLTALLPIREEGVLRIFITLKSPSPWLGSNPQPLGSVSSTVTITPPRRRVGHQLHHYLFRWIVCKLADFEHFM
jgi:hypothetical protein